MPLFEVAILETPTKKDAEEGRGEPVGARGEAVSDGQEADDEESRGVKEGLDGDPPAGDRRAPPLEQRHVGKARSRNIGERRRSRCSRKATRSGRTCTRRSFKG